jgi:hypothetical protein
LFADSVSGWPAMAIVRDSGCLFIYALLLPLSRLSIQ